MTSRSPLRGSEARFAFPALENGARSADRTRDYPRCGAGFAHSKQTTVKSPFAQYGRGENQDKGANATHAKPIGKIGSINVCTSTMVSTQGLPNYPEESYGLWRAGALPPSSFGMASAESLRARDGSFYGYTV